MHDPNTGMRLYQFLLAAAFSTGVRAADFHVAPGGSDTNAGSPDQPFATLGHALDVVRAWKVGHAGESNRVLLHTGEYRLDNTIILTPDDSGTPGAPLIIQAAAGEVPVLTSARTLTGWLPVDAATPGLQAAAANHVLSATIPAGWRFHFLYLDGQPQTVARLNKASDWRQWPLPVTVGSLSPTGQPLTLPSGLLDNVPTNGDLEMNLMPVQYWNTLSVVRGIDAPNNTCLRLSKNPTTFWTNTFANGNFNLQNALKFLTQPGEWCVDSTAGKVYFWPPGDSLTGMSVWVPGLERLVEFQGSDDGSALVHDVEIKGLTFTCTDRLPEDQWPDAWVKRQAELPDAMVYLEGVADCVLDGNTFLYSGSYCVALQNYAQRVSVLGNEMAYPGCGGVLLQGYGPGTTDINHDNIIRRNYIHHTGNGGYLHSAAVTLYQSGANDISLNWIDSVPYVGIQIAGAAYTEFGPGKTQGAWDSYGVYEAMYKVRWSELPQGTDSTFTLDSFKPYLHSRNNRMTNNILTGYMNRMSDGGGIYSWSCGLGNLWDSNLLRRDFINPGEEWCFALYMDDYVDGATLSNNVCWHTSSNTTINKGANTWTNNTVSSTKPANYDSRLQAIAGAALTDGGWLDWPHDALPSYVGRAVPSDGQNQVLVQTTLAWTASIAGFQYDLYFGTDRQAVADATTGSPEYLGRLTANSYAPANALTAGATYYWRVDAVASSGGIGTGEVWSFTTATDAIHGALRMRFSLDARDTFGTCTYDLAGPPYQDGLLSPAASPPSQVTGRIGEAFHFDGTSAMVTAQSAVSATGYAVSLWFRTTQANAGLYSTTSSTAANFDRDLYLSGGKLNAYLWNGGASEVITSPASTLNDGQWHHAVHTLGGSAGGQKLYLDGALVASGATTTSDPTPQTQVRLGFSMEVANHYLSGDLDDVMIWDRALDATEVTALHTAGLAGASIDPASTASDFTWSGGNGGNWNDSANWNPLAVPGFLDTAHFDLNATPSPAITLAGDLCVGGLVIGGGSGALDVSGAATLTVGPGGIVVNDPAFATATVPVVLRTSQTWTVSGNGTLDLTGTLDTGSWILTANINHAAEIGGAVTGSGGLVKTGAGALVLSGSNTYTGGTTVNAGTLTVNMPDSLLSTTCAINSGGTLELFANDSVNLQTNTHYTGAGVLRKTGAGMIGNANNPVTFNMAAGAVFDVRAGDWNLGGAVSSESMRTNLGSMNVEAGATFHTSNTLVQVDALTGGGKINNAYNSSTPVLTIGVSNTSNNTAYGVTGNTATFSGTIGYAETYNTVSVGTISVVKTGTGTQVLAGSNNYTGATSVEGGVLLVTGSLAAGSAVTVMSGGRLGGTGTIQGPVTLQSGGTLGVGGSAIGTLTLGSSLTMNTGGSVVARISKTGGTLGADKIYLAGSSGFAYAGSLVVSAAGDVLAAGDRFTLFGRSSGSFGSGNFSGFSLPVLPAGLGWDVTSLPVDGSILVVTGSGIVGGTPVWTNPAGGSWGTGANWQDNQPAGGSGLTADFGTLLLGSDVTVTLDGARTIGGLKFGDTGNAHGWTLATGTGGSLMLAGNPSVVNVSNPWVTIAATLAGTNGLTKTGAGMLTMSGANTFTGATLVTGAGLSAYPGVAFNQAANLTLNSAAGQAISGNLTLGNNGDGRVIMTTKANNQFGPNSVVTLNATGSVYAGFSWWELYGTNQTIAGLVSSGSGQSAAQIENVEGETGIGNATLTINTGTGTSYVYAGGIRNVNSGTSGTVSLVKQGAGTQTLSCTGGQFSYTGSTSVQGGTLILGKFPKAGVTSAVAGAALDISAGATCRINYPAGTYDMASLTGGGTLELAGTGTYDPIYAGGTAQTVAMTSGALFHIISGYCRFGYGYAAHWINNRSALTIDSGATLDLWDTVNDGNGIRFDALNGAGTITDTNGNNTLYVGTAGGSGTFAGTITQGSGRTLSFTKNGNGTQTLAAANTYTGATRLNGGTLAVNGSLAAGSAVTVNPSATLAGTGTVAGTVNILSGAFVAPGNAGVGTLATGPLVLTGSYVCEISGAACDRLAVSGDLNLNGAAIVLSAVTPATATSYVIATYTGTLAALVTPPVISGLGGFALDTATAGQVKLVRTASFGKWIDGFTFAAGADKSLTGDPDHDGISNGVEMVLGGNPATGMDAALLPVSARVTADIGHGSQSYFKFTYRMTQASVDASVVTDCQYATDPTSASWTAAVNGINGVVIATTTDGFATGVHKVEVWLPVSLAQGGRLFARLRAVAP